MVSVLQLSKVFYEFENSLFGAASCTFCKAGFMFLQYYLDRCQVGVVCSNDTTQLSAET